MFKSIATIVVAFALLVVLHGTARAQELVTNLSKLLTEQQPVGSLAPDVAAANATLTTVAGLFAIELTTLPVSSSSGGFVYRLNRNLGLVERASDAFGPFFTDRVLRNSRGQSSVGMSFQFAIVLRVTGSGFAERHVSDQRRQNRRVDKTFQRRHAVVDPGDAHRDDFRSYGLSDQRPSVERSRSPTYGSAEIGTHCKWRSALQSTQSGSATGLGDIMLNAR